MQVISVGEAGRAQVRVLHWESGMPAGISNDPVRYSYDSLTGSSGLELDGEGNIISQEEYYPNGGTAVWTARSAVEAEYRTVRYSGKERDATGLYYYGYRYYQPWAGRWLSADPAGTVDGLNLFRMCRNNPVTLWDIDGLAPPMEETRLHRAVRGYGLDLKEFWTLDLIAKVHRWDINVRTGNSSRVQYVGQYGHRPKPAGIYQKTNKTGEKQGLVLYQHDQLAKGKSDMEHIAHPSASAPEELQVLSSEGMHLQEMMINGELGGLVVDKHGNDVYGDIDIHSVLDSAGLRVDPETWVNTINTFFEKSNMHTAANLIGENNATKPYGVQAHSVIQHGAHDDWSERNNEAYAGGINMGPQPGVINITGSRVRKNNVFNTTDEYRTYLKQQSSTQDSVYTENAWKAGDLRSWRSGATRSWSNKPSRRTALMGRRKIQNLIRKGLV